MANTHYFPITEQHRREMLTQIGAKKFHDLLRNIPNEIISPTLDLPEPLSELDAVKLLTRLANENADGDKLINFAGAGAYEHFIPAAVDYLTSRGEFSTAYTPYQAEASQGTLEAMFEFQTMICELTGMQVSNASLYDGATSLAEACLVATAVTGRKTVLIAELVHPEYREVVETYFKATGLSVTTLPMGKEGTFEWDDLEKLWDSEIAGLAVATPNCFGLVENLEGVAKWIHERGSLFITVANPISMAYFKSMGEWEADIACGDLQPLGIPLSYGGPYAGYFATTNALMRRIPGRICGEAIDSEGARAFTLTLQAREQHIRRERASSNICTNQALCALRTTVFLSLMGRSGLRRLAELNLENAYYLKKRLSNLDGVEIVFDGPMFNEFVFRTRHPASDLLASLRLRGFLGGVALNRWFKDRPRDVLVCATETKDKKTINDFVKAVEESL